MADTPAVKAERMRDLRGQITGIDQSDVPEILFMEISPGRAPVRAYSTKDGCPVDIPGYMIGAAMELTNEDGTFRFVAEAKDAPVYKQGTIKCFLHLGSPERPILEMVGLGNATCPAEHLASAYSKRIHAQHRHKQEWAAYSEYKEDQKEAKREARQERQLEATLSIARGGTSITTTGTVGVCDVCGKDGLKNVGAHKRGAHKEG